jgi:signal transduction histidine kinase
MKIFTSPTPVSIITTIHCWTRLVYRSILWHSELMAHEGSSVTTNPGKLLIVDDDPINRMLLSAILQEQGYLIYTAEHGRRALELLAQQPFDAVLLDLIMPELDGFQVLEQIKRDPALQHIPIIVISALDEMESIVRCIEMGATDHLPKPVDPVLLRARLNASLAAKRMHDQEAEYLQQVSQLTAAAAAVEAGSFEPSSLAAVADRSDELGQLARVFGRMVSEIRARELHLEEQNRVKTAFIGRMTHELRSPFVTAGFSVQLLRRYAEHGMVAELHEQIRQLERDLTEGRRLIDSMISFAALVSRRAELSKSPTQLPLLITHATEHLHALASARSVTLSYDLSPGVPDIEVDRTRMSEAISHLVHNAIKFSNPGGEVHIACWSTVNQIALKVEDNGIGIAPHKLDLIWEAFGQAADDERRGVEGLGIGLALVKQVVEAHGGEVAAMSREGHGSTFGFRLPLTL